MPMIEVCGIMVNFPFEPYPCQVSYMEKVITCLKSGVNGILESPTGTGKTLCLLCASLAWLEDKKAQIASHRWQMVQNSDGTSATGAVEYYKESLAKQLDDAAGLWTGEMVAPKIIYASRTHSQLTQAMQELKRTAYKHFKVSVLGSREQLCIHPQVMREENNTTKVHMCRAKVSARMCHFYNNVEANKQAFVGQVMDIEDMVKMGTKINCCPYYASRELKTDADIIFLPYNYLLDAKSRKAQDVQLAGNIVIFDEAHNLEKICEDSASFDWTSAEIAMAIKELGQVSEKILDVVQQEDNGLIATQDLTSANSSLDMNLNEVLQLKNQLVAVEEALYQFELSSGGSGVSKPGQFMFEFFEKVGVTYATRNQINELIDRIVLHLTNNASSVFHSKGHGLSKFSDVLKIVFSREQPEDMSYANGHRKVISKHYKVHIQEESYIERNNRRKGGWDATSSIRPQRTISYWCFSAGHTMEELKAAGVKSVLLTSGTLSPMDSFKTEMGIEFPIELENPHVISKEQVWIGVVGKGPDGVVLTSAYTTRFNEDYMASLGNSIVNFARIIPGGLLVFFPSYPVMGKCTESWQSKGIWSRIEQHKPVFVEPKGKADFTAAMDNYYSAINDPTKKGAALVAVCRGKVSEGLDFSDSNGRAVVITGLPFPPRMDPKVVLKMAYLDELRSQGVKGLTGQEWYRQQASRAVNQAIGRVIRHKDDYGAIILCDNRFSSSDSTSQLPSWVRPSVKIYENFGLGLRDAMNFFKNAEKNLPVPKPIRMQQKEPGCQGAYFMPATIKTLLPNITKSLPKASSVDEHVPSMASDEAKLKEQYFARGKPVVQPSAKRGLLEALDSSDKKSFLQQPSKSLQTQIQFTPLNISANPNGQQKKKIILKGVTNAAKITGPLASATEYVAEVKSVLSSQSYAEFSEALTHYKQTKNYHLMVATMGDLFLAEVSNHHLFQKLYRFVLPTHRERFKQTCREITGLECVMEQDSSEPENCKTADNSVKNINTACDSTTSKNMLSTNPIQNMADKILGKRQAHLNTKNELKRCRLDEDNSIANCCSLSKCQNETVQECKTAKLDHCSSNLSSGFISANTRPSTVLEKIHLVSQPITAVGKQLTTSLSDCEENTSNVDELALLPDGKKKNLSVKSISNSDKECDSGTDQLFAVQLHNEMKDPITACLDRSRSDIKCCYCGSGALVPLKSIQCSHVCCMECWKTCIRDTKKCPQCNVTVKRRHLARIYFPSANCVQK